MTRAYEADEFEGVPTDDAADLAGVPDAFQRLWTVFSPAVAGYLRLQGATEPDDLTSEVFLGVFTGLSRFEGDEDALRSWVFTIARNPSVRPSATAAASASN